MNCVSWIPEVWWPLWFVPQFVQGAYHSTLYRLAMKALCRPGTGFIQVRFKRKLSCYVLCEVSIIQANTRLDLYFKSNTDPALALIRFYKEKKQLENVSGNRSSLELAEVQLYIAWTSSQTQQTRDCSPRF